MNKLFCSVSLQHLPDAHTVRASMLVDPVTQAAVSAGISASDVGETVVSTTMSQVVDIPSSGGEVSVGDTINIPHGQVQIMEVADGTAGGDVQVSISEAMQTGHVTVEASDTLGITVPAEILAAMAAAQSHPHLLIATADQQLMQAQVNVATDQQVLEAQAANSTIQATEGASHTSEAATQPGGEVEASVPAEQLEQPMETD